MSGRGELLQFKNDVLKVVVSEPKIADAIVVSPREVMVNGKSAGHTTLVIWENGVEPATYDVQVTPDLTEFENTRKTFAQEILNAAPNGKVVFNWNGETIVLTGSATADEAKRAQAVAGSHAKTVVNLIQTPPAAEPRQILLQVKFATVDRVALSELGFNLFSRNEKMTGATSTQQFQGPRFSPLQPNNAGQTVNFADLLNIFVFRPDLNIGATIRALQQRNLLQILAEPNLIVVEGKEASFLAGGEFPFPTLTATPTGGATAPVITVQFKKFGVQLNFTPTMTPNGAINLQVAPEVSALDFTNAVVLEGFTIPAIATRRAETEVLLRDGESFAIAGLIDNRVETQLNKVYGLGNLPILGQLFRSRSVKKTADELLVVVTPRFVKPLSADQQAQLPATVDTFLPTVPQEKAAAAAGKKKKNSDKEPQFVGPRGHQEP
jgi:pilus assembly protein CpaC